MMPAEGQSWIFWKPKFSDATNKLLQGYMLHFR